MGRRKMPPSYLPTAQNVARRTARVYVERSSAPEALLSQGIYSRGQLKPIVTMKVREQYL